MFAIRSLAVVMTFLVALTGRSVHGNASGAPVGACDNMTPGHSVPGQTSAAPYQLTVSKPVFGCKETIKLTLNSSTNEQLKGYLCQARTDVTKYVTTGTLTAIGGGKNFCNGTGSVTHMSNVSKSVVDFEWTAAEYNAGVPVNFVCTVVKSFNTFWVKGPKVTVTYEGGHCPAGAAQGIVGTWTTWAAIAVLMVASVL
ncbi:putative defense protein 3 [Dreissena polymorpha]|uniref:Reelin domain-containing protein n=1 Tax=Dreissena polymorpha TaxID=45954 RepID=A0A9D4EXH1_DREPO|nr:putative defense protein 3 [Dreissena polymorpha]KAH3787636.1 hypothetical protein DPMN_165763 [Dreissena polymorpha]